MPVAFRSVGAPLKADMSSAPNPQVVPMPAGHVAGDLLLLVLVHDANTAPTSEPGGWTLLDTASAGTSTQNTPVPKVQTRVYYRVAAGVTPSAAFAFPKQPWPAGSPFVLAFTAAYSGVDPAGPIEKWTATGTANTAASQNHPQLVTVADGDWLLTLRTGSAAQAHTVTATGGTNTERLDDSAFNQLFAALYDSAAGLAPGTQTRRTTTSAGGDPACQGGSTMWSLALKPVTVATIALPGTASVAATALGASVLAEPGGWNLCGVEGLPEYRVSIAWGSDGPDDLSGRVVNTDPYFRDGVAGWTTANGSLAVTDDLRDAYGVRALRVTPSGVHTVVSAYPGLTPVGSVTAGQTYTVHAWIYSPNGWSDMRVVLDWINASDAILNTAPSVAVAVPAGKWTYVTSGGVAPAGAVRGRLRLRQGGATPAATDVWYAWGAVFLDPSTPDAVHYPAPGEDVTGDIISDIPVTYGRDQERQFSPAAVGSSSATLNNAHRRYSPENAASTIHDGLAPARPVRATVTFNGRTHPLFRGRVDDFDVHADFGDRTASFTFLDGLNFLSGVKLSTEVHSAQRTGDLIHAVLDAVGWTGGRDIDRGATVVEWWWLADTDALTAVNDLVKSEGPPAIAYVAPDGTFTFRDRHHRMLRQASLVPQAFFHAGALGECTEEGVPSGALSLTKPFTYSHGWRDIVNSVAFDVQDRAPAWELQQVWEDTSTYTLTIGQSLELAVSASDPFINAVVEPGVDIVYTGPGVVSAQLDRRSGALATLTLRAIGDTVTITSAQVRAQPLTVQQTVRVTATDPTSVNEHGERTYPETAPWAGAQDAAAIANLVLLHYAQRRPTVQIRVASTDPAHFMQVLQRTVNDRVHITNDEMRLDSDFFVEKVAHTIQRVGRAGRPPVHAVVLSCEKAMEFPVNPFTFDVRGAGFDAGVFDPLQSDEAGAVFIFDHPQQGVFDSGEFGT